MNWYAIDSNDELIVNGTVSLGGGALVLSGAHLPPQGTWFTIIEAQNNNTISGDFGSIQWSGKPGASFGQRSYTSDGTTYYQIDLT